MSLTLSLLNERIDGLDTGKDDKRHLADKKKKLRKAVEAIEAQVPESCRTLVSSKLMEFAMETITVEKDHFAAIKQRDTLESDLRKSRSEVEKLTTMLDKLQNLCRDLQVEAKQAKLGELEATRRLEEMLHRASAYESIEAKIQQHVEETRGVIDENAMLKEKLSGIEPLLRQFQEDGEQRDKILATQQQKLSAMSDQLQVTTKLSDIYKEQAEKAIEAGRANEEKLERAAALITEVNEDRLRLLEELRLERVRNLESLKMMKELKAQRDGLKGDAQKSEKLCLELLESVASSKQAYETATQATKELHAVRAQRDRLEGLCRVLQYQLKAANPGATAAGNGAIPALPAPPAEGLGVGESGTPEGPGTPDPVSDPVA